MHIMLVFHLLVTVRSAAVLTGTPRDELATFSARRRALSVAAVRLRAILGMPANGLGMRHRERGARALDSLTSSMVRIAHR